jgi:hypothetical protein
MTPVSRRLVIARIARDVLGIETLETRNADSLDFHDLAIWDVRRALLLAFNAGQSTTTKKEQPSC